MKKEIGLIVVLGLFFSGCAQVTEVSRTIWGTSTRALDDARIDAITLTYECNYDACYDAVLAMTENSVEGGLLIEKEFSLFHKNYIKGYIVIMGVPGNVDTTEVGIFFSRLKQNVTKMEVSSLSRTAKEKVAETINDHLKALFAKVG